MKVLTKGRALWSRTITSTIIGQGLDSVIFITIAFVGTISSSQLVQVILTVWVFKSIYEIIFTPITYAAILRLKKIENLDTYDYQTNYNPFSLK
jgi:queuosine precursor transporter